MCKKDENGAVDSAQKAKKVPGVPFTVLTAKKAQEASVRARNLRTQVRTQMLEKMVQNYDFTEEMLKALKKSDMDKLEMIQKAMVIIGITHNQSEDAIQKVAIDAKTDNNTKLSGSIEFVLPKKGG